MKIRAMKHNTVQDPLKFWVKKYWHSKRIRTTAKY